MRANLVNTVSHSENSVFRSFANDSDRSDQRFFLALERLAGRTDAITVNTMFEFLYFVQNEHIIELQPLESEYLAVFFNSTELDLTVCSVEFLIARFEKAKADFDEEFLRRIRDVHREARRCVDAPEVKSKLRSFSAAWKAKLKRKMWFQALNPILAYVEMFGDSDSTGKLFGSFLPSLISEENLNLIASNELSPVSTANR